MVNILEVCGKNIPLFDGYLEDRGGSLYDYQLAKTGYLRLAIDEDFGRFLVLSLALPVLSIYYPLSSSMKATGEG